MNFRWWVGAVVAVVLTGCTASPADVEPPAAASATAPASSSAAPASSSAAPASSPAATSASPVGTTDPGSAPAALSVRSVLNFRDVAGDGIRLDGGAHMATGVVYRSGYLYGMSIGDQNRLAEAGITDIYDLRTTDVALDTPDPQIEGATYHLINVFAVDAKEHKTLATAAASREHFRAMNHDFVADPAQRERIANVLTDIANDEGPSIIHCSEGKDRAGWVSAMLQFVAGADEETVIEQYLLSNTYRSDFIEKSVAKARRTGGDTLAEAVRARVTVYPSYLRAGLKEATARYGGVEGYLTEGLGLTGTTLAELRSRLRQE